MNTIPNPWSLQVEMTQGCNRRCEICGIHSLGKEASHYKFMVPKLAEKIAVEMNEWIPKGRRIEFALQGEPTINPKASEIIHLFRDNYPKCQMMLNTNGYKLSKERILSYFNAGLNFLLIDIYDEPTMELCRKMMHWNLPIKIEDFHSGFNVYQNYGKPEMQRIVLMDNHKNDSWKKTRVRKINNQAGFTPIETQKKYGIYVDEPLKKNCSNVHRELVIKYDGLVPFCCMNWSRVNPIGKFPNQSLQELWTSPKFQAVRQMLYNKDRAFAPCDKCNYSGFKLGFIKDPEFDMSREEMLELITNVQQ